MGDASETNKRKCDGNQPKNKSRTYDEANLGVVFTVNVMGDEERPVCMLCLKTLAADSMRPNKLRRHFETSNPSHVDKPLDFFQRKLGEYRQQEHRMVQAASENNKEQMASSKVTYRITQCKKTHDSRGAHTPRSSRYGVD